MELLAPIPAPAFWERDGYVLAQNDAAANHTGLAPENAAPLESVFLGAFPETGKATFECILLRASQQPLPVLGSVGPAPSALGGRIVVALERPRSDESGARSDESGQGSFLGDLLDSAPEAMAITHEARVLHVNREFTRLFGYTLESSVGRELDSLLLPEGRAHENEILEHLVAAEGRASLETVRHTSSGETVDVSLLVAPVRLGGKAQGLFYTFRDIRRQKQEEARLHHNAMHDSLTGLANRALFLDRLRLTLSRLQRRPDRRFAVMFVDLDRFKQVNDTLGHAAGDHLLLEATKRLRESVRPQDTVSRFGGDEFAVLMDEAGMPVDVERVAVRIQKAVQRPVAFGGQELKVTVSIGIAFVTTEYESAEEILRDADLAMYQAKARGKAQHAFAVAPVQGTGAG
jgi:Amt family ammonium transporter